MENLRILPSVEDAERDLDVDLENQSQDVEDADVRRSADTVARRDVASTGLRTGKVTMTI